MTLIRPPVTDLKTTIRADHPASACSPSVYVKPLSPSLSWAGNQLLDRLPPPAQFLATKIKQLSFPPKKKKKKICVSLLILCFDDVSIGVRGVLSRQLLLYCYQFILICLLVFPLCIEVLLCWGHKYYKFVTNSSWIDPVIIMQCPSLSLIIFFILKSILSEYKNCNSAFFCFPFTWNMFFPPFTFCMCLQM